MTDDSGLRRAEHLRRRHPDAGAGPHRQGGPALHAVPLHGALLADARALITGRNHHSVGFGVDRRTVHRLSRATTPSSARTTPPIGAILSDNGYATSWFGKNHNTPTFQYSAAGPFDQWPSRHGLRVLLRLHGRRDRPVDAVPVPRSHADFPVGRQDRLQPHHRHGGRCHQVHEASLNAAAPDKPFFVYYVPGGTHAPHQPTKEWIDKFKGKFDMGWNKLREQIFANQKRLGVIPANTQLTPWPDDLPKWDSLSPVQKKLLRARGRGVRRLRRLHRPRDRPRDPGGRGHGQARQHADHLHQRRQRHQRRRHARWARRTR